MKICFVIPDLDSTAGGWGRYANDLISCARSNGHELNVIRVDQGRASLFPSFFKILACRRSDIVYALDGWPFGALAWLTTRLSKTRLVVGAIGTYTIAPLYGRKTAWITQRTYKDADKVISISTYTRDRLLEKVSDANVIVVTPGINPDKWKVSGRAKMPKRIISVGALKERKGYHTALEAFSIAKRSMPELLWTIVGNQEYLPYVESLKKRASELGVLDAIEWHEDISDQKLLKLYEDAGVFMMLSENTGNHFEGFGIVFLEAAAAGLPVLGTKDNGIESAVGPENGFLVEQKDPWAAADALVSILSDKDLWRRMSGAGRKWADEHDLSSMCGSLEAVYAHITKSSMSGRT